MVKTIDRRAFREVTRRTMSCLTNSRSVGRIIMGAIIILTITGKTDRYLILYQIFDAASETCKVCHLHPDPIYYNYDTI